MDDLFDQRLALARKLSQEYRFTDAIVMFNWLCEVYPDRAAALVDSASAFSRIFDYAGVQKRFAQVDSYINVPSEIWTAMAHISQWLRRPEWARRFLLKAVSTSQPSAETFGIFAIFLERHNDLDQAPLLTNLCRCYSTDPFTRGRKVEAVRTLAAGSNADSGSAHQSV